MNTYTHTQIGYLMLSSMLAVLILFGCIQITTQAGLLSSDTSVNGAVMLVIFCILASFATLTVLVDETYILITFGYGLFRKKFLLEDIVSVRTVRNHWYYGWGVRVWFWPKMWIYNVSGFDAVEILTKTGKRYRIGTDTPTELERAIHARLHKGKVS